MKVLNENIRQLFEAYGSILIWLKKAPRKRILIIGHMRSGSSLLSHILASNPEITGIGETHTRYNNNKYHRRLVSSMLLKKRKLKYRSEVTYIMDKVLHNFILDESILEDEDTLIILLIRQPAETIPSILNLFKDKSLWGEPCTFKEAADYYVERLNYIVNIKNKYGAKCFFIDYSDFLINYDTILKKLSLFLSLKIPLSSSYKLNKYTGKRGAGDPSENVLSGKILNTTEKKKEAGPYPGILEQDMSNLQLLYEQCKIACSKLTG